MRRCLILTKNPAMAASLQLWATFHGHVGPDQVAVYCVGKSPIRTQIVREFHVLADWIEEELGKCINHQNLPEVVVLTDFAGYTYAEYSNLNAIKDRGWATVLGMLILGFPEIHWVFVAGNAVPATHAWVEDAAANLKECDLGRAVTPENLNFVFAISQTGYCPLFDATGMRNRIRKAMNSETDPRQRVQLPVRSEIAIAVDEEQSYAFLHAYTAYRFGFRSNVITTMGGMNAFLREREPNGSQEEGGLERPATAQPMLIFEDVFLRFPDDHRENFSHLRRRDDVFPYLARAGYRIIVTSGHHWGQDEEARLDNPGYLRDLRAGGQWNKELGKPLGGIFNLWVDSKLDRKLRDGGRPGLAPGYLWPLMSPDASGGHSTPGRLLAIADRLIARSERLFPDVQSVPQAVYGATLATDALELLAGKTPTTALEALAIKHQFEVLAECQFVGTGEHVDVRSRKDDIRREVRSLSEWFGTTTSQKNAASWNAELAILNKLIRVFRDNNQFDEEQVLTVRARQLHRKLRFAKCWFPIKVLQVFAWYAEKLVASFPLFFGAIVMWILVLGGLYAWWGSLDIDRGLADACSAFLSLQPPSDDSFWKAADGWNGAFCLVAATIGLGFVHLGIFISHLYSIISRK